MVLLSSAFDSFIQLVGALAIFLFVLVITYFTTKWIGGYQKANMHNKNLSVVESLRIGSNKYIALVRAGETYLVVAVGKDEVNLLASLTAEQLSEVPAEAPKADGSTARGDLTESFGEILNRFKERFPKK